MIKSLFAAGVAATVLAAPAASQKFVCALGYATAATNVGAAAVGDEEQNNGALLLHRVACASGAGFLSDDPSLLGSNGDQG